MRVLAVFVVTLGLASAVTLPSGGARAGMLAAPGPNPNWTDMQQYEWYIGYLARAGQLCGTFTEAAVLHRLARMSPYGGIGLNVVTGDGFSGTACARINADAREIAADAKKIQEYLEAAYSCQGEGCYGQSLSDWQFHECGNSLKSHFAILDIDSKDVREVTMMNPAKLGSEAAYLARVQFHSCQGSLYIDLSQQCVMEKKQTRGDCEIDGVERY